MRKTYLGLILLMLLFSTCTTIEKTINKNSTLDPKQTYIAYVIDEGNWFSVKEKEFDVDLINIDTGRIVKLKSSNGDIQIRAIEEGKYIIGEISYEETVSYGFGQYSSFRNEKRTLWIDNSLKEEIEVIKGEINFLWYIDIVSYKVAKEKNVSKEDIFSRIIESRKDVDQNRIRY